MDVMVGSSGRVNFFLHVTCHVTFVTCYRGHVTFVTCYRGHVTFVTCYRPCNICYMFGWGWVLQIFKILLPRLGSGWVLRFFWNFLVVFGWGWVLQIFKILLPRFGSDRIGCGSFIHSKLSQWLFSLCFLFRGTRFQSYSKEQREAKPWPNFSQKLN